MNTFTFIKELKKLEINEEENEIVWLEDLIEKWLKKNEIIWHLEVEENNIYDWQKNQTWIKITIWLKVKEKDFQIKASYNFYKENCKIDYYSKDEKGNMILMIMPEDIYDEIC